MTSYRKSLEQIGIPSDVRVAYSDFYCKPKSLSQAMNAMQLAGEFSQVSDISITKDWTKFVQGCGTDGTHWFFTSNQKDENQKWLYVFKIVLPASEDTFRDEDIVRSFSFNSIPIPGGLEHIGQFDVFEDKIYVSHFNGTNKQIIVLQNDGGTISFHKLLQIDVPISPIDGRKDHVQFQCIVPWDRTFLTCFGDGNIDVLFVHDLADGRWTGRTIRLQTPISDDWWVQGAAFSTYGHLFIATSPNHEKNKENRIVDIDIPDEAGIAAIAAAAVGPFGIIGTVAGSAIGAIWASNEINDISNPFPTHNIHIISPLNGKELSVIPVCAEGRFQELEGCCFNKYTGELNVVLQDTMPPGHIYFKSFRRNQLPAF